VWAHRAHMPLHGTAPAVVCELLTVHHSPCRSLLERHQRRCTRVMTKHGPCVVCCPGVDLSCGAGTHLGVMCVGTMLQALAQLQASVAQQPVRGILSQAQWCGACGVLCMVSCAVPACDANPTKLQCCSCVAHSCRWFFSRPTPPKTHTVAVGALEAVQVEVATACSPQRSRSAVAPTTTHTCAVWVASNALCQAHLRQHHARAPPHHPHTHRTPAVPTTPNNEVLHAVVNVDVDVDVNVNVVVGSACGETMTAPNPVDASHKAGSGVVTAAHQEAGATGQELAPEPAHTVGIESGTRGTGG